MMCQGLLWIEFVMASTRVASVSFRLKRVRRFLSISMISYAALATLLLVLALGGSRLANTLFRAINVSIETSVAIIFLYASHKMAAQHSQRDSLLFSTPHSVALTARGFGARFFGLCEGLSHSVPAFDDHSLTQAKVFARMTSNIKALIVSNAVNALSRTSDSDISERRTSGRVVRAQRGFAAHMERQLADLHEKEMRIARCAGKRLAMAWQIYSVRLHTGVAYGRLPGG